MDPTFCITKRKYENIASKKGNPTSNRPIVSYGWRPKTSTGDLDTMVMVLLHCFTLKKKHDSNVRRVLPISIAQSGPQVFVNRFWPLQASIWLALVHLLAGARRGVRTPTLCCRFLE